MSVAEERRFKARNLRELHRQQKAAARAKVRELRDALRHAREHRRVVIRALPGKLRAHRLMAREQHQALKHRLIMNMRIELAERRQRARAVLEQERAQARAAGDRVTAARMKLEAERRFQADMRRIEADNRNAKRQERAIRRGHHHALSQSDDTVRGNIPPDLVPLWDRVKGRIKGSDRKSRTEAFLQYAEEHPGEVFAVIDTRTDAVIAELERDHRRASVAARRPMPRRAHEHRPEAPF